jgi:lipopolysaccharide/colanic/teichoic acid biosynthesis glycosyltransferase
MLKRTFDFICSLLGIIILSPFLLAFAVAIRLDSRGPVFYRGVRVGLGGRPFRMFKFRSMVVDAEQRGANSTPEDDWRVTSTGRFLRKHKLDELPQLFSVLKGDMSLVGPRPQVLSAVEKYTAEEKIVLTVRPGITDFASLRFRNEGEILRGSTDPDRDYFEKIHPEKMRLGIEYVRDQSFRLDCKILFRTVSALIFRSKGPESGPEAEDTRAPRTVSQ